MALRLAREIEQALSADAGEDARWQRLQRQVTDELGALADALRRHGNNAAASFREEGVVVEVTFRAHTTSLPALAAALAEEVEERRRLLDSREREILENHLVGEAASTLQELISAAEKRVADTNRELAERPTSTGMQLRLRWTADPEGPDGLADARARLLRQTADAWSEADRAAVGGFLQNQIKAVRAQDATATWLEHLTRALDYRRWHRFTVERRQSGTWQSATGPSSGGERVLAASVPLFAAASSYYSSAANPHAPRLVMLDEAFAGVDDRARAKCLGLLAAFDLDVVMTSEREWGCYAEVPGLAIAQLSRIDGVAAVLVTRWEWDGAARRRVEAAPEPPLVAAAPPDGPTAVGQVDHERLKRLLGDPELAWVLDRVRRRIELGQPMHGTIARRSATSAERDAVAQLFGRQPRPARGLSVSLDELDALLRRSGVHSGGLAEAVVTLTGAVTVRADRIAGEERAWTAAFTRIEAATAGRPELAPWIGRVRAGGVVKRLAGGSPAAGQELLDALASVVAALPASGGESLSAFAARVTGHAHGLDDGSPLGTLALGAARALAGLEPPAPEESAAEARREAWAAVGVLCDELSSIVLTLGLPGRRIRHRQAARGRRREWRAAVAHAPPARPQPAAVVRGRCGAGGRESVADRVRGRRARRTLRAAGLHQRSAAGGDDGAPPIARRRRRAAAPSR